MIQINPNRKIESNFPDSTPKTATDKFTTLDGGLVNALTVDMTPIQDLHGQSKPWAGGAGKNIMPLVLSDIKGYNTSPSWSWSDNKATHTKGFTVEVLVDSDDNITGFKVGGSTNSPDTNYYAFKLTGNVTLTSGVPYSVNGVNSPSQTSYRLNVLGIDNYISGDNNITGDGNAHVFNIQFYGSATDIDGTMYPMLRLASIADPTFEPYSNICPISGHTEAKSKINNTVYTTSLGTTVYGGELDMVSGEGEVTLGYLDLGSPSYNYDAVNRRFTGFITGIKNTAVRTMKIVSDIYETISNGQAYDINWDNVIYNSGNTVIIHNHAYTDPDAFKTAMSGHYITYDLATPTTLTLTGQNITAEVGENNVSAPLDGQEIQTDGVTYKEMFSWADVVAYVQSQVNP